jgi:hypothetical protein
VQNARAFTVARTKPVTRPVQVRSLQATCTAGAWQLRAAANAGVQVAQTRAAALHASDWGQGCSSQACSVDLTFALAHVFAGRSAPPQPPGGPEPAREQRGDSELQAH